MRKLGTTVRFEAVAILALLIGLVVPAGAQTGTGLGPVGKYIVVLRDDVPARAVAQEQAGRFGFRVTRIYENAIKGYVGSFPQAIVERLKGDARVAFVEADQPMQAFTDTTQTGATWGLDRIDQRQLPLSTSFSYSNNGAGVTAYVIDTGIRLSHTEFGGRASSGFDAVDGGSADDCNGHGTHVAGTVGGATYGVAKGVNLVAVRVLDCKGSGSTSGVIAGVDWVTADHQPGKPAVANMSLGGGRSTALDMAVKRSIADGVVYAIAAGNGYQNACNTSPARVSEAMTVSATDNTDTKASFANYGKCVDWFAPGVGITSAWSTSDSAVNTISGTSMAAPHTAGVAAQILQTNPGFQPQQVRDTIFNLTTKNVVINSNTTNKHLLFTNF